MLLWLLACTGAESECGAPGEICTFAGTGQLGFNGDGLSAEESWLYFPSALREDPSGRVVIVDFNNMRVRAVEEDGTLSTLVGNGQHAWSTPGALPLATALENPIDAVWSPDRTLYILPLHEARVLMVMPDGTVEPCIGGGEPGYDGDGGDPHLATISEAAGIAAGPDAIYVADTQNNVIRVVRDDVITTLAGSVEPGFVDGAGADARFSGPQRISLLDRTLYVADANNHAIRAVDVDTGVVRTVAGTGTSGYAGDGGPAEAAELTWPQGVTAADDGALWIADSGNNVVRVVRDGAIETFAGSGVAGYSGDGGSAADANFSFPVHVLVRSDGVYIADMKNGAVRVVR